MRNWNKHKQTAIQALLLASLASVTLCQHARVAIPVPSGAHEGTGTPAAKRLPAAERETSPAQSGTIRLSHGYFLFGLYPRNVELSETELCPGGIAAVDQYTSFRDGLFEQLTLGVYSPRTVEVRCR
jgi:hypothetical protein